MSENTTTVEYVDPCPGMKGDDTVVEDCGKCLGSGQVSYGNVTFAKNTGHGSVEARWCFDCNGTGKYVRKVKNIRSAERRRVNEQNKAIAAAAEAKVAVDAWAAQHPTLAARLAAISSECTEGTEAGWDAAKRYGNFITDLAHQTSYRPLSDAQVEAVTKALAEYDERTAADEAKAASQRHYGTTGEKFTATGTVIVSMNVDGYAYGSIDRMVIIEGTGEFEGVTFKATGSGATLFDTERGDSVEFTATVKKHAEYKDTPQTVVTRAKIKVLTSA